MSLKKNLKRLLPRKIFQGEKEKSKKVKDDSLKEESIKEKEESIKTKLKRYESITQAEIKILIEEWYFRKTGKILDLENPRTYNEKIQWTKIYGDLPLMGKLADKFLVRDYVASKIGAEYLTNLYGVWDSEQDINFEELPKKFVLKATHGCNWNLIVTDKDKLDETTALSTARLWLMDNFSYSFGYEMHYSYCEPRLIAEEYLTNGVQYDPASDRSYEDLYDYKFWCFDGKVYYIQLLTSRAIGIKMAFYDCAWDKMNFVYSYQQNTHDVPKPDNLELMIRLAEKLAEGFPHVRVDFYRLNDGRIVFGEMTFTTRSGVCTWDPPEADEMMGTLFHIP